MKLARVFALFVCSAASIATGCADEDRRGGPRDGGFGGDMAVNPIIGDGGVSEQCADSAKLVYLVDSNGDFLSFKPDTGQFTKIGTLSCPAQFLATPFSMGVDRTPTAWVLYSSGELFKVSTEDASCEPTSYVPGQKGYTLFGMGFASNSAGSSDETLYIAGGAETDVTSGTSKFGSLSIPSLSISNKGNVSGWPELTGTGEGKLWGFFPSATTTPKVAQIDKSTGVDGTVFPLASLSGQPTSWAFAFWGGDFWIFLARDSDSSTKVYRVNGQTGALTTAIPSTGRTIVGAGVSTCAPTQIL